MRLDSKKEAERLSWKTHGAILLSHVRQVLRCVRERHLFGAGALGSRVHAV